MNKKRSLEEICFEENIKVEPKLIIKPEYLRVSEYDINLAIEDVFSHFYGSLILIGGILARKGFLGYKNLRKPSNDLDLVITNGAIIKELNKWYGLKLIQEYNALFGEINHVCTSYHFNRIHDLDVTPDFIERARTIKFKNVNLKVSSPEYVVFTKLLRADEKDRFFGKDKLDISSILLNSTLGNLKFDEDFFSHLINSSQYTEALKCYLNQIVPNKNLNKQENYILGRIVDKISKKL